MVLIAQDGFLRLGSGFPGWRAISVPANVTQTQNAAQGSLGGLEPDYGNVPTDRQN